MARELSKKQMDRLAAYWKLEDEEREVEEEIKRISADLVAKKALLGERISGIEDNIPESYEEAWYALDTEHRRHERTMAAPLASEQAAVGALPPIAGASDTDPDWPVAAATARIRRRLAEQDVAAARIAESHHEHYCEMLANGMVSVRTDGLIIQTYDPFTDTMPGGDRADGGLQAGRAFYYEQRGVHPPVEAPEPIAGASDTEPVFEEVHAGAIPLDLQMRLGRCRHDSVLWLWTHTEGYSVNFNRLGGRAGFKATHQVNCPRCGRALTQTTMTTRAPRHGLVIHLRGIAGAAVTL